MIFISFQNHFPADDGIFMKTADIRRSQGQVQWLSPIGATAVTIKS